MDLFLKKNYQMLGMSFSSNLDWESYLISTAKSTSMKLDDLICSMNFIFAEVAFYLYKCPIQIPS